MIIFTLSIIGVVLVVIAALEIRHQYKEKAAAKGEQLPRPSSPSILSMEANLDNYLYTFTLPAIGADDVVSRELHIAIDGTENMYELGIDLDSYSLELPENSTVDMWMIDIDDAGNRSLKGEMLSFVVLDIIPPSAPAAPVIADVIVAPVAEEIVEEPVAEEVVEETIEEPVAEEIIEEPVAEETLEEETLVEEPMAEETTEEIVEAPAEETLEEETLEEPVADEIVEEPVAEEVVEETIEPIAEETVDTVEEPVVEEVVEETTDESTDETL